MIVEDLLKATDYALPYNKMSSYLSPPPDFREDIIGLKANPVGIIMSIASCLK